MAARPSNRLWLLSCLIAYAALAALLALSLYQGTTRPIVVTRPPQPLEDMGSSIEGRIDPNTAAWFDLTRLPRVGESLARGIVAYREAKTAAWRAAHPDAPPEQAPPVFTRPEDLLPVRGIGQKMLEGMRPHLRLPADGPASAPGAS